MRFSKLISPCYNKIMANILYGVAGEGSGHSSRAKEIIKHLEKEGHFVKVVSYDRGYKNLSPYFDVEEIFGLKFTLKDNQIQYVSTFVDNLIKLPEAAASVKKILKMIDDLKIQIVFSDFEPISCVAANIKKIPLISIDNQHQITNTEIDYPAKYKKDALAAKTVINLIVFNAKSYLVASFLKPKIIKPKTFLFPPILREEILQIKPRRDDYILVYLSFQHENTLALLKNIKKKFVVYGFDKEETERNMIFKKASQQSFLQDLAGCQAVIASAGFALMTEAFYLGKPYLALPVKKQFEQMLNAFYLDKLGYGKYYEKLDKNKIELFLSNLDKYGKKLKKYKKQDNSKILRRIDELIKKYK